MYHRDSKIMRKLLGKSATDTSTGDLSITSTPTSITAPYRPSKSQDAVYNAGVPIARLDVSPDRRAVILGGGHILKTIILDDAAGYGFDFSDGVDVRAAILSQQPSASRASVMADQLSIRDVKWHNNSTIFTAGANGRIFSYDLNRIGTAGSEPLEYIQMQEDSRQVNSLDVNPHLKSWILSGSQDGFGRVFDAGTTWQNRSGGLTFRQRFAPLRCIDPIREVKWSPKVGHEMACCTESGVILKWDVRHALRPLLRINAHDKACSAIAWHPDGSHLISAGWDAKLHVWDLGSTADKRQKPKWTINTPAPVRTVAWRPGIWSASARTRRVAQVAVTYDENSNKRYGTPVVHVWDLARPTLPYKEVERFDTSPIALWWKDQDMLWTVGQDHMFNQCDVAFAPKVIDRLSTSAMAFSPKGDALLFLDERLSSPRPRHSLTPKSDATPRGNYNAASIPAGLSVSKSDSEEEVIGTFLGPRWKTHRTRRHSARSTNSISTTGTSAISISEDQKAIMGLEQALKATGMFKTHQAMTSGHLPAAKSVNVYQYLSGMYLETLNRELPFVEGGPALPRRILRITDQYAKAAETVNLFRLAQVWRVLSFAMTLLLDQRAKFHLDTRLSRFQKVKLDKSSGGGDRNKAAAIFNSFHQTDRNDFALPSHQAASPDKRIQNGRSLLAEEMESTSNVPTPLARPVDTAHSLSYQQHLYPHGRKLAPILEPDSLNLGPAAHGSFQDEPRQRHDSTPLSIRSQDSESTQVSHTEGYDFYDTDALAQAIDVPDSKHNGRSWHVVPPPTDPGGRRMVARHDSEESYGQMFSISEGNKLSGSGYFGKPSLAKQASDRRNDDEFESRIRGEQLDTSSSAKSRNEPRPVTDSPEEMFMISQTTAATDDTYASNQSLTTRSFSSNQANDPNMGEANVSNYNSQSSEFIAPPEIRPPFEHDTRPHVLETDYLHWSEDPDYPFPSPQSASASKPPAPGTGLPNPYVVVQRALDFECRTSALNASAMILLLKPLVPESIIDTHQARGILRQHHSRLMSMGLFVEAALLRNLCIRGWPAGLPDWGENYESVFGTSQQSLVKVNFFCSSCRKPREIDPKHGDEAVWTCERCKSHMAPCAVCGHRELALADHLPAENADLVAAALDKRPLLSWWYCPGCAHGGHSSCLQAWHGSLDPAVAPNETYSDGCCPLDGCGHACLPGKYRGETTTARAEELGRAAVESSRARDDRIATTTNNRATPRPGASVKSDGNDVPQSRAVGMAREALNGNKGGGGTAGGPPTGGGILSSSPGRAGGGEGGGANRERRKSVKFAASNGTESF
ncbi:hypothetical protein S40293_00238 [Stachybotrys chartarum IBT 40293]|nr:hypothetical protein S40293_00238 [Stachybotrys chartarum IBT 40293]